MHKFEPLAAAQGLDVEDSITEMQGQAFEEMGVAGAFGLTCLPRISTAYAKDEFVMQVLTDFALRWVCHHPSGVLCSCWACHITLRSAQGRGSSAACRAAT